MGKGFFGIFSKKATDSLDSQPVQYEKEEVMQQGNVAVDEEIIKARDILQEILDEMGFISVVKLVNTKTDEVILDIKSEDTGRIIGKDGATLNALQLIMRNVMNKKNDKKYNLVVDSNQYRQKKIQSLELKARKAARTAVMENKEVSLGPMSASDRRIIHLTLENNDEIETYSKGEKDSRQVFVAPKKNRNTN